MLHSTLLEQNIAYYLLKRQYQSQSRLTCHRNLQDGDLVCDLIYVCDLHEITLISSSTHCITCTGGIFDQRLFILFLAI